MRKQRGDDMELVYCGKCERPTHHMTRDFYGRHVHKGDKCLTCGMIQATPEQLRQLEQELQAHELGLTNGG